MRLAPLPLVLTLLLAGCGTDPAGDAEAGGVQAATIAEVQGSGARSPLEGRVVATEGIVNGVFGGGLGGVFVASPSADDDPATAEGLFVVHPLGTLPKLRLGDRVKLVGTVRELGDGESTLTAIEPTSVEPIGEAKVPHLVLDAAPLQGWEALEGTRLRIAGPLTVSGVDGLDRFGELTVAFGDRLYVPTELEPPGDRAKALAAGNAARRLRLDDGRTATDVDSIWYLLEAPTDQAPLRVGSRLLAVEGVLDERFGSHRLQLVEKLGGVGHASRPAPPQVAGDRRIASFNLHNLFNGDGAGGGFPTARGAKDAEAYARQQQKLVAVVQAMQPDLAALMELENDGYGPESSLAQFVAALNAAGPASDWQFVDAGEGPGTNEIRVGLIYRASRFIPVGTPVTKTDGPFAERSRAPLVQAFQAAAGGPVIAVAANHFKSKGCGRDAQGADTDQGDGQGCFNGVRVATARWLHEWLGTDPTDQKPDGTLVIGDLNAYAQEDPLRLLGARGWQDAFAVAKVDRPYSFVYDGASGRLDHALVDPRLAPRLRGAAEWHVNADELERFGYGTDRDGDPWRASDHDPILLGFDLTRPAL